MVDRPARVVAKLYGQAGRPISRPVSANPRADLPWQICKTHETPDALIASPWRSGAAGGPGISSQDHRRSARSTLGYAFANRLCPDESLLRQNAAI
ncbi:hypothetical protein CO674_09335 [Rhizobium hidalgonense]|uniref:Uncharacterized protein n=1 Tax=Rhizobium hidalgonense TaxID=1538159 RepID=A0ABX4JUH1_9HYPH|nr:hypothetical protein CO674_09335 [Rhizobium hidalgonense]RWX16516.1 hypothetical protein EHI42_12315 [Rhizobium hidalgonense]